LIFCVNAILKLKARQWMIPQPFDPKLINQLLEGHTTPEAITGENGLLKQLTKAILERALHPEMTHHLGHEPNARVTNTSKNARNGTSKKTMLRPRQIGGEPRFARGAAVNSGNSNSRFLEIGLGHSSQS
jgi:hypothetical protein